MISPTDQVPPLGLDSSFIKKYDHPVPRYTSYPTALQFHTRYLPEDKARDLGLAAKSTEPLSLYIHLPFCASICLFCACNVTPTRDRTRTERYLSYLIREIDLHLKHLNTKRPIDQLHFGGGSPTFFTPGQLARLLGEIQSRFNFTRDAEISIECNPRETTPEHLHTFKTFHVNRLSFGVQDLNETVQRAVNRIEPESLLKSQVALARKLGFKSLSFDLIYGLPHQTTTSFEKTLRRIMHLRPDRIALFNFAYLPEKISRQRAIDAQALPSPRMKHDIFFRSLDFLAKHGYLHIGLDHFALPQDTLALALHQGTLNRNFQGYHARPSMDLIGLGVSAISNLGPTYSQNYKQIPLWEGFIDQGKLPVHCGIRLTSDDLWRRQVIHDLLCQNRVDFRTLAQKFRKPFPSFRLRAKSLLSDMEADDLLHWEGDCLYVTGKGRLLVRNIASVFDAYLEKAPTPGTFSRSI